MPTKIEWTHMPGYKGETWNPVTGCVKISPGCANCYAETMLMRFKRSGPFLPSNDIQLHPDRLELPRHWSKPRMIFVNSISDTFHEQVPDNFILFMFRTAVRCPQHLFLFLTKRPDRMLEWFQGTSYEQLCRFASLEGRAVPLDNVWLGTSAENQYWANIRFPLLLQCPAVIHFGSLEPLLGPIDLTRLKQPSGDVINVLNGWLTAKTLERVKGLDQVIVGGESGNSKRIRPMHLQWARDLRGQTKDAGKAFFFKQWGKYRPISNADPMRQLTKVMAVSINPHERQFTRPLLESDAYMIKGSKGGNGNLLDGQVWQEFPDIGNERKA